MPRIACLLVPDLPVAALCRADPELIDRPLIVADGDGAQARIVAAAPPARARGVRPGVHSVAQAQALDTTLLVHRRDPAAEESAVRALLDVAASLASRIERTGARCIHLDATGAAHVAGGERGLASALAARAERVGLAIRVGIGASMTVSRLAALHGDGCEVVPPGAERGFLAPLPIACLAPPPDITATLARWGVHRLGDLARLPVAEVATRLGSAGVALVHAARGDDPRPLAPMPPGGDVEEAISLEWALDTLEPLFFVLRAVLDRVVARLGLDGIGCARLGLTLGLDDRSRDLRTLDLPAPTREPKALLGCLRAALESRPPRAAVTTLTVRAVPDRVRPAQLGLFAPPGPAPERLAATLARLGALCGPGRVGTPVAPDTHRPGAAAVAPFAPPAAALPDPTPTAGRLVVRALRPPRPLEVFSDRDAPCFVRGLGLGGRVVAVAGPWRIAGEWWSDAPWRRDYYDLELSDGGLYRCYRDDAAGGWFADGVYD